MPDYYIRMECFNTTSLESKAEVEARARAWDLALMDDMIADAVQNMKDIRTLMGNKHRTPSDYRTIYAINEVRRTLDHLVNLRKEIKEYE